MKSVNMKLHILLMATIALSTISAYGTPIMKRLNDQAKSIEHLLEFVGQAIHNKKIEAVDPKQARQTIVELQAMLQLAVETQADSPEIACATYRSILDQIEAHVTTKFDANSPLVTRSRQLNNMPIATDSITVEEQISANTRTAQFLMHHLGDVNLSTKQKVFRYIEDIDTNWHLATIAKRVAPYVGLLAYYTFVTNEQALPKWKPINQLKRILGKMPKVVTKSIQETGQPAHVHPQPEATNPAPEKPQSQNTSPEPVNPRLETTKSTLVEPNVENKNPILTSPEPDNTYPTNVYVSITSGSVQKTSVEKGDGIVGTFFNTFGTLVDFKKDHLFKCAPMAILAPIIKKDIQDLAFWGTEQAKRTYCYIKNAPYRAPGAIKPAKGSFKDIVGYQYAKSQLSPIVDYHTHKRTLDMIGQLPQKGYLIAGSTDTAEVLAQSLGGEISSILKKKDSSKNCSIYTVDAPKLGEKSLTTVIKYAEKHAPCIVVINNIDWLSCDNVGQEKWAQLLSTLGATLGNTKHVYVIGTTMHSEMVSPELRGACMLASTIYLSSPSYNDRYEYLKEELRNRFITIADKTLIKLAKQTGSCSYDQLQQVINHALILAQSQGDRLKACHICAAIDTIIHHIYSDYSYTDMHKKQLFASYQAGTAVAHAALDINEEIIKVTLLPVNGNNGITYGCMITEDTEQLRTENKYVINHCKVLLAGIAAQEMLYDTHDQKQKEVTVKEVVDQLVRIECQGIAMTDLPKKVREEKLEKAWKKLSSYQAEVQELLAENRDKLVDLVNELLEHDTVDFTEKA